MTEKFNDDDSDNNENIIEVLLNQNKKILEENKSISQELESLKNENKNLKINLDKSNKLTNKILDSYNENFKLLFNYYDLKPKSVLKNMQDVCQQILDLVVNICNKHGIEYWLDGAALLGAIRHEGFLPGGDDIDLGMMRKDYELFQEVFDSELKEYNLEKHVKWKLLRHGNNVLYFIQISCAGFAVLDIFPYDYIEDPPENIKQLYDAEKNKFKSNILEDKSYSESINDVYANLNLSRNQKSFVVPGVERPGSGTFFIQKTSELFPLTTVTFNNQEYCAHKNNDYHIKKLYGDSEEFPKILERHKRVYKIQKRPNINQYLEYKVDLLKKTNDFYKINKKSV